MANEITPWKIADCTLDLSVEKLSRREPFSREINQKYGEGGALNANYRTVEAVAIATGHLERNGLRYGRDFVWKTGGGDVVSFDFSNHRTRARALTILLNVPTSGIVVEPA